MIIVLRREATEKELQHIIDKIEEVGLRAHVSRGVERTIVGAIGDETVLRTLPLEAFPGVESVMPILKPYKLASRELKRGYPHYRQERNNRCHKGGDHCRAMLG